MKWKWEYLREVIFKGFDDDSVPVFTGGKNYLPFRTLDKWFSESFRQREDYKK